MENEPTLLDHKSLAAPICELLHSAYRQEAELIGAGHFPPLDRQIEDIARSPNTFYGLTVDLHLAGVIEIAIEPQWLDIVSLGVDPEQQRTGVAIQLIRFVLGLEPGMRVIVQTGSRNTPALELYSRFGFHETGSEMTPEQIPITKLTLEPT